MLNASSLIVVVGGSTQVGLCNHTYIIISPYTGSHLQQMAKRAVGRPWSATEDQLLAAAVAVHGQVDNWKAVALAVPGRSNKACRKACTPSHRPARSHTYRS